MEQDFLDEMIEESTKRNSDFHFLMKKARARRALVNNHVDSRSRSKISQQTIARRIKTSQSSVVRLAANDVDSFL